MKGFSLVELVVSVAIFVLMIAGIYGIFNVAGRSYSIDSVMVEVGQQARQSMHWMVKDLREGEDVEILSNKEEIQFDMVNASRVRYFLNENNQIVRQENGGERIVGSHIEILKFDYAQNIDEEQGQDNIEGPAGDSIIQIEILALRTFMGQDLKFSLTERVRLRNE